ncbi:MAG TPA: hypothetical protein VNX01_02645 [Bacteroidia bacterium]|nr:hypothetical protein [Bacteroidia bacterium]
MKTKIATVLALLCLTASTLKSQTLEEALQNSLTKFDAAKTEQEMVGTSSQFDMITNKWSDQWVANFYAAYAKIKVSLKLTDKVKRDQYLDAANALIEKADNLSPNNEEIYILAAWSAKARIAIDGKDRWKKFGEVYDDYIAKAKKINSENARIFFLEGQGPFYKPKMWGGGKDKAKPYFEKAKELFAKEDKTSLLKPYWGEKDNEELLKQCNE